MTDSIEQMKEDINCLRSHGAHETPHYSLLAMAGEVGELCNIYKKELRQFGNEDTFAKACAEVPDILFYLLQFCTDFGIDINAEWDKKMFYNANKYGRKLNRK